MTSNRPVFDESIVYVHSQSPSYVRVEKNLTAFAELFRDVHFVGCSRGTRWPGADVPPGITVHMHDAVLPHGMRSALGLPSFLLFVRRCLRALSPDVVVAVNEEAVLPFQLGLLPRPRKLLVCEVLDSLAIRVRGPLARLPIWQVLSSRALARADGVIEVTDERLVRHPAIPAHATVIPNAPRWRVCTPSPDARGAIYVGGSVVDGLSGLETLLQAVEAVPAARIVFAGRPYGRWINRVFLRHPRVAHLGEVTPDRSLQIAAGSLALWAHYKPVNVNYVYAAPNKLYDAMMLGKPIFINKECKIAERAARLGIGIVTSFSDVDGVASSIRQLLSSTAPVLSTCAGAQGEFREIHAWDHAVRRYSEFFTACGLAATDRSAVSIP